MLHGPYIARHAGGDLGRATAEDVQRRQGVFVTQGSEGVGKRISHGCSIAHNLE
jgi:hypothetical protein